MFKLNGYRLRIIKALAPFSAGVKRFFFFSFILSLATIGLTFLTPVFYRLFIDDVVVKGNMNGFIQVAVGYMAVLLLGFGVEYMRCYSDNRLHNHIYFKVKHKIFKDLYRSDFLYYDNTSIGEMKMNIEEDTEHMKTFADKQLIQVVVSLLTLSVASLFLLSISWKLSLIAAVNIPLTLYLDYVLGNREKTVVQMNRDTDKDVTTWLNESLRNWKEIKTLTLQNYEKRIYKKFLIRLARIQVDTIKLFVARSLVIPWVKDKFVMQLALYFFGGLLIIKGELTIGSLLVFALYYNILSEAIKSLSNANATLLAQQPIFDRILNKLSFQSTQGTTVPSSNFSEIVLENVSFKYVNSPNDVLHNINLKIGCGEKIVVMGGSGEGKSTLVKLATGIYQPSGGTVTVSNIPIHEIKPSFLYKKIGFVMQDAALFNMSIKQYFLLVNPKASDRDIIHACEQAFIYDFIEGLPNRLDTVIGEGGVKVSGGQRQRLILAGQFLREVDILVFDEATNHLDSQVEDLIYEALDSYGKNKSIIYITHRDKLSKSQVKQLLVRDGTVQES